MVKYKINDLISWRTIDGQVLILDSHISESAHELNDIGSFIFVNIAEGKELQQIKEQLLSAYPLHSSIEDDFTSFVEELEKLQLIVSSQE